MSAAATASEQIVRRRFKARGYTGNTCGKLCGSSGPRAWRAAARRLGYAFRARFAVVVPEHHGFAGTPAHGLGIVGSLLAGGSGCITTAVCRG